MTNTQMKKHSEFIHNAVDYIDELKGNDWQIGGGFASGDSVFVSGSNSESDFCKYPYRTICSGVTRSLKV